MAGKFQLEKSPKKISHVKPGQRWEDDNKMILQDYVVMKGKRVKSHPMFQLSR